MEATATRSTKIAHGQEEQTPYFQTALSIIEHEFPFEFFIAGELAQLETFAIPSISALLHRTRQYEDHGLKRLDDTKANLYPIFTSATDDPEREKFMKHLNWVHSHYTISNDDNVYTLLRMFLHPIEWINKWGRRQLSDYEMEALVSQVREIGLQMNIRDVPASYEEMQKWQKNYRQKHEVFHQDNADVTQGMMHGLKLHFPKFLGPLVEPAVTVLLDNIQLTDALGLKRSTRIQKVWVHGLLKTWTLFSKTYRPWKHKKFSESVFVTSYPSYPKGIDYCKMGPEKLLKARDKTGKCPFH